jgi:hypothetical protein
MSFPMLALFFIHLPFPRKQSSPIFCSRIDLKVSTQRTWPGSEMIFPGGGFCARCGMNLPFSLSPGRFLRQIVQLSVLAVRRLVFLLLLLLPESINVPILTCPAAAFCKVTAMSGRCPPSFPLHSLSPHTLKRVSSAVDRQKLDREGGRNRPRR